MPRSISDYEVFKVDALGDIGLLSKSDMTPNETPPNALNEVNNLRPSNGSLAPLRAYSTPNLYKTSFAPFPEDVSDPDPGFDPYMITHLDYVHNSQDTFWVWFSDQYVSTSGSSPKDPEDPDIGNNITTKNFGSAGLSGNWPASLWSLAKLNSILIGTKGEGDPVALYKVGGNDVARTDPLISWPNWPVGASCKTISTYKNFIVCGNVVDDTGRDIPNGIWWSHPADPGFLPGDGVDAALGWAYANPLSQSGLIELGRDSGAIQTIVPLRDSMIIYCENAIYRMTFIKGEYIFKFTEIFANEGAYGPNAVVEFEGKHLVVGKNDIFIHDGQQKKTIANRRTQQAVFQHLTQEDRNVLLVAPRREKNEIWVMVRAFKNDQYGHLAADTAIIYNWTDDVWTATVLRRSWEQGFKEEAYYSPTLMLNYLPRLTETADTDSGIKYDDADFTYESSEANINYGTTVQLLGHLVPVVIDGYFVSGQEGSAQFFTEDENVWNGPDQKFEFTSESLDLGGDESNQLVTAVFPNIQSNDDVLIDIWVGSQDSAGGDVTWTGPFEYNPKTMSHIKCRVRGRRHALKMRVQRTYIIPDPPEPEIADWTIPNVRFRGYDLRFVQAGRRS